MLNVNKNQRGGKMCYCGCFFEDRFTGECNAPVVNSKDPRASCFFGFVCSYCGLALESSDQWTDDETICKDCAEKNGLKHCSACGYNSEEQEREGENDFCPSCGEKY